MTTAAAASGNRIGHIQIAILILAVVVSFFVGLGSVPLFDKDEGAFCEATREMVDSGNYLMTYMNGLPRYDKPILIYWLQAIGVGLFGLNEFALRFPSAVAAALWALATYRFARRILDSDKAFLATFFLVTALQVTIIAKAAIADALLNCLLAVTMFETYHYCQTQQKKHLYLAFAWAALGMLTKGPVALVIPLGTTFLFCLMQRDLKRWLKAVTNPIGILLFLLIAAPWYIAAIVDQGRAILDAWIFQQTIKRMGKPLEGHSGNILYYIPVIIVGVMPYTALLFKTLRNAPADWKVPLTRYLLLWFGFVFVFFSFLGTKLPHYAIYGYTPLFLLMAMHLDRLRRDVWLLLPTAGLLVAALVVPVVIPISLPHVKDDFARAVMTASAAEFGLMYYLPLVMALCVVFAAMWIPGVSRKGRILLVGFVMACLVNWHFMPLAARVLQEPVREAALVAKANNYDVIIWKLNMPSFVFYRQQLTSREFPGPGSIVFTKLPLLKKWAEYDLLYEKNGIALARIKRILLLDIPDSSP